MGAPVIDRLQRWSHLIAESSGLSWQAEGARILAIEAEMAAVQAEDRFFGSPATADRLNPLYHSVDESELSGGFFHTMPIALDQATAILNLLAARICEDSQVPIGFVGGPVVWRTALHFFGPAIVDPCFATLRPAMESLRLVYARLERYDQDDALVSAEIGSDDPRFEEAGIVGCARNAEHATLIARFDIDEEPLGPAFELVETRSAAALRALRGAA